jgi:hypothetical protein
MVIFRKENVIDYLDIDNIHKFSFHQILRYICSFPHEQWNSKATEILNILNSDINYEVIGKISKREKNIRYQCTLHKNIVIETDLRHIIDKKTGCYACNNNSVPFGYRNEQTIIDDMTKLVNRVFEQTGLTFVLSSYQEWDSALVYSWRKHIKNNNKTFYKLLKSLNLPNPTTDCYLKDGNIFRGFFEFVGYCLIKEWNIPFEYSPKVFDRFVSDGYFTDLNTHWEHWGELNKNNKEKKKLYSDSSFFLYETFDSNCQKNGGINYLYVTLREFLLSKGYFIPEMTHQQILDIIKGSMTNFDNMMSYIVTIIKKMNWDKKIVEIEMRPTKEGNIVLGFINKFFNGSILDFKLYLNNNYNFNYSVTAKRRSYDDLNYFIGKIKPFIVEFGCIPTQEYFMEIRRNDIPKMAIKLCGGFNNLRKNEIEEGPFFYLVKDLYKSEIPNDRQLEWNDNFDNNSNNIIDYYKNLGFEFPKTMNTLRHDRRFEKFGPSLHSSISKNGGWNNFRNKYKY